MVATMMYGSLAAGMRVSAIVRECLGLILAVADMLKSRSDYSSVLSLVTDYRLFVTEGLPQSYIWDR